VADQRLALSRAQILGFRRQVHALDERLALSARSLRLAAWAGLQDSVPRAALLSLHARVKAVQPATWEHASLAQLWGPRFCAYVVATQDVPVFSLGRLPRNTRAVARAQDTAARLHAFLKGRRMPFGEAGRGLGVPHNSLRYATQTGTVLLRWDGARQPVIWSIAPPDMESQQARLELLRRYLHVLGPGTAVGFAGWAGIPAAEGAADFAALAGELTPVRTPLGEAWILEQDEDMLRAPAKPAASARLLPSGDAYYLLRGTERTLLLADARQRAALWTSRVWPGALLVDGEIAGVWRRNAGKVSIAAWRRLSAAEHDAVEAEAASLPLPDLDGPVTVDWE
jgi:hypothetical protein